MWARENTREELFDAMNRREVYATSGTRIAVKMYAGWDLEQHAASSSALSNNLPATAVPMGSDLTPVESARQPQFFVWAAKDINSANLQRIQMVKGWIEGGEVFERVQDIACTDGNSPDPVTRLCPDNGATVNLTTCQSDPDKGSAELNVLWRDSDFDPKQSAFYYVRVLENPICRWSTHDALRLAQELKPQVDGEIQERAWSSPIWYTPTGD